MPFLLDFLAWFFSLKVFFFHLGGFLCNFLSSYFVATAFETSSLGLLNRSYSFLLDMIFFYQVTGSLALNKPKESDVVSGVLVKKNFNCHIISPQDLSSMFFLFWI